MWIGCAILGAVGSLIRAEASAAMVRRHGTAFPWGTLAVNLSGAFALGLLHGSGVGGRTAILVGVALLGSLTTFSTWMVETLRVVQRSPVLAGANLIGSLIAGFALILAGNALGQLLLA